ncbi:OPT oligopeptide transporter protein-domain-containing protein [Dactylonectria macrodidyma]|uniref:OPT oligopeptide transporter protein-domain-containing protein n=1 Tax=Dactylonectria macrodidyma TaxID=307937 RepID=A0A9P9FIU0_9HYPO|nr:OPT oligopeptide transporter protein-domain-containing protein [Dactylonectria macrodidyma]
MPFPVSPDIPNEPMPLTIRAVLWGWTLGILVNASNVYLGLKMGMANDANMLAAIVGYNLLKVCQQAAIPLLADTFGPKEHNLIQTIATGCGGLSTVFIAAVPAMYQLGLMSDNPSDDYWRLVTLTAASAFFGTAMSLPLRRAFIIELAEELELTFPSAVAVATTIRNFYLGSNDPRLKKATRILLFVFAGSLVWVVGTSYAKGILFDWYIFWWFYVWGNYNNGAIKAVNWGFVTVEWTPVFLGLGSLVGINIAASWLFGYVISFGIIGPILVAKDAAVGTPYSAEYPDLVTYLAMESADPVHVQSPRYWLLWPAVLVMITASLTDVGCRWKLFARFMGTAWFAVTKRVQELSARRTSRPNAQESVDVDDSSQTVSPRVVESRWVRVGNVEYWSALLLSAVISCVVLGLQYHVNVGLSILTLVFCFLFSLMAVQCTGQSGTSPISMVSNLTQLVIGGILRSSSASVNTRMLTNLVCASVASTGAQQACEMTTDFKIGYFLGTPPRLQWYGQWLGTVPAIFLSPAMFIVFMKGYGCVLDLSQATTCAFSAPAAATYRAVTMGMLSPTLPVTRASWIFSGCACAVTVIIHVTKAWAVSTERKKLAALLPNMMMVSMGFLVPASQYGIALLMGALAGAWWKKRNPEAFRMYCFPVAAGMIGGESIAGLVQAILNIARVGGPTFYGTNLGCPGGYC